MATTPGPFKQLGEHPSTYVVQDRSNEQELLRLDQQDRLFTECMGGVLSEQPDPTGLQRILDVGCGPGWWLIKTAKTYPGISVLTGIDISGRMIEYARMQAEAAQVNDRVQLKTGDALRMLEFPDNFFDLVNQRFAMSWLRKWDWSKMLREYQRVCSIGGVIRVNEAEQPESNSPALTHLIKLFMQAFYQAGHRFSPERGGVLPRIAPLLEQYGITEVQSKTYTIAFHTDPGTRELFVNDMRLGFRTALPFLRKWTRVPVDYEDIYQRMVQETQQPDFEATQTIVTAWGINRENNRSKIID